MKTHRVRERLPVALTRHPNSPSAIFRRCFPRPSGACPRGSSWMRKPSLLSHGLAHSAGAPRATATSGHFPEPLITPDRPAQGISANPSSLPTYKRIRGVSSRRLSPEERSRRSNQPVSTCPGALPLIAGNGVIRQSDAGSRDPKFSEHQIVNNSTGGMSLP
jgi:hypothetical protein